MKPKMPTHRDEARDRDQHILDRLARIEQRVDSLDQTSAFALRAEAPKHLAEVTKIFKHGKRRAQIYLAADGNRGVNEIADHLRMQRQNVGPNLKILGGEGLLEVVDVSGRRDIWAKKSIDHTLRITKHLCEEYCLKADGKPAKAKKGKRHKRK